MTRLVFIHGWSFDPTLWDAVADRFPDRACQRIDLGFTTRGDGTNDLPEDDYIAVGHSLGSMWALRHATPGMKGLISICGFDEMASFTPPGLLSMMKRRLETEAHEMLTEFWPDPSWCGAGELNISQLKDGLDWLAEWDETERRQGLIVPVLALGATEDRIVPRSQTERIWGDHSVVWHESADHFLPLTQPDWCADHIKGFLDAHSL